jgi:lipoprotein-anchoring transpeptidase ErfK/SrfK/gas vesicle protein
MQIKGRRVLMTAVLCMALAMPNAAFAGENVQETVEQTTIETEAETDKWTEETTQMDDVVQVEETDIVDEWQEETDSEENSDVDSEAAVNGAVTGLLTTDKETEETEETDETEPLTDEESEIKNGLVTESDGHIYYYENGEMFTGGYKTVTVDGKEYHYYFQTNGQAFTNGLLEFVHTNGKTYYFYFQANGQAYTNGYKCLTGRYYTDGTKMAVKKDNTTAHYYFQTNGQAFTNGLLEFVHTNGKTYYFYFQANGQAYTNGYKLLTGTYYTDGTKPAVKKDNTAARYYFQTNGQAFKNGFLEFVNTSGKTYYFYFQNNAKACTNTYKAVSTRYYTNGKTVAAKVNDSKTYYYYFQANGQAYTNGLLKFQESGKTCQSYFQSNGRAYTGGWKTINGKKYYFAGNGKGSLGLSTIGGKTYYFDGNGVQQFGWVKTNGKWYYMDKSTGVQKFQSNTLYDAWKKIQSKSSNTKYFIVVDTDNTQTMIFKGSKGNWEPIYDWNCSVGKASTPTVKGTFTVGIKGYSFGSGYTCYYYTQFYGDYLFHSVLYHEGTFKIRNGNLGKKISHGCIRLDIDNAKWIYDNIPRSTKVYVY